MIVKHLITAIALASLMGIVLPVASAQAPPCFTFADGQTQAFQCPAYFRPAPATGAYYPTGVRVDPNGQSDTFQAFPSAPASPEAQSQPPMIPLLPSPELQPEATNATAAEANQTGPATNLTSSDIEPVRNSLNATRESLERNDTQAAIESINRADGALFAVIVDEGKGALSDQLFTLSDDIDTARESVFNLDNEKALADLNAADSQLLVITEMLPTATPTATENPEPQPQPSTNETLIFPEQEQSPANQSETLAPIVEPQLPTPGPQPQPEAEPEPTINIKIPLNKTQQEIITIEEIGNINKTTHEKTTISIIEGNKTSHRDVTTTEVPL